MVMKLIMFDYDGVIVDSFRFLKKTYLRIGEVLNIKMSDKDEYFRELLELDWRETYRKLDILAKDKVNISEFIFHHSNHKYSHEILPYEEIPAVLKELSKTHKLAIVSNNFKKELEYRLKKYDLMQYLSAIYSCDDGELKPHPDLLMKCMARFKVEPKDAAFIGDMDGDIMAGKAAGVKTIAVTYGYHLKHRLEDADVIIDNPTELLKIF